MSIRCIGSNKWQIDYYPQGRKGKRVRQTFDGTEAEAREYERIVNQNLNRESLSPEMISPNATVAELFPAYLEWYEMHRAKTTHIDVESVWRNHLKQYFGALILEQVNIQNITTYKKLRKTEKGTNRTINKELHYFSGFLSWCAKQGYIKQKQFKIEGLPYVRPVPMILSFDETLRLIEFAEPFYQAFFLCLYSLGLRMNEARYLKVEDIDQANSLLQVKQKGGSYKTLPVDPILMESLKKIMPKNGFIFVSKRNGQPIRDIRKAIARAKRKAGITKKIYPHLLRHSFATHLLGKNVNLRTIQQFLGHSQVGTTEWYTHVAQGHLQDAQKKLWEDYRGSENAENAVKMTGKKVE